MDKDNKVNLRRYFFGEIVDKQYKRVQQLNAATILIKSKNNIKDELQEIYNKVLQVSYGINNMRAILEKMKEQNTHSRELLSLIGTLNKRILYQKENVPPELIQGYQNADKQTYVQTQLTSTKSATNSTHKLIGQQLSAIEISAVYNSDTIEQEIIKDCKRTLFNEPEICPTISFISPEEFNKVPKYIIGRQTLDTINNLISDINNTLITKYTILSLGKAGAQKRGEINLYLQYKKQEYNIKEEKGYLYFFTAEDYYMQTKKKIDKTKLNLITALRHCKRLRECRTKNELRYVIIN
ncbi:spindle and kinetochore-associated protein 1-like [Cataglyphis hispanica]|uniref:spindle and kinetochore-associated protein 1-like n=1 Tax=Cataglyphis hispanica TaxID=1086592 RepID=UPI00217FACDF|nr:spindle and kinetochore-associated protein 1-like [Cataglyphis hispanica]XP_050464035.1 spindle and kinetochore-associated protein 1-like [Cataglyphis hispanica]